MCIRDSPGGDHIAVLVMVLDHQARPWFPTNGPPDARALTRRTRRQQADVGPPTVCRRVLWMELTMDPVGSVLDGVRQTLQRCGVPTADSKHRASSSLDPAPANTPSSPQRERGVLQSSRHEAYLVAVSYTHLDVYKRQF